MKLLDNVNEMSADQLKSSIESLIDKIQQNFDFKVSVSILGLLNFSLFKFHFNYFFSDKTQNLKFRVGNKLQIRRFFSVLNAKFVSLY